MDMASQLLACTITFICTLSPGNCTHKHVYTYCRKVCQEHDPQMHTC